MDSRETELNRSPAVSGTPGYQSSDEIRRRIEARRADMDVLADVLQEKLSPQHIAHEVRRELRGHTAKAASSLVDSVKANPFPWMVVGVGLAWLIKESRQGSSRTMGHRYALSTEYEGLGYGYGHETRSDEGVLDRTRDKVSSARERVGVATEHARDKVAESVDRAKEKVVQAKDTAAEKVSEVKERLASKVERAGEKVGEARQRVVEKAGDLERRAEVGFWQAMERNPLAVGAVALGIGLGIALAVPATRREEEILGPLREQLLDKAKSAGQQALGKVEEVAQVTVKEVGSQLGSDGSSSQKQSLSPGSSSTSQKQSQSSSSSSTGNRQGSSSSLGNDGKLASGNTPSGQLGGSHGASSGSAGLSGLGGGSPLQSSTSGLGGSSTGSSRTTTGGSQGNKTPGSTGQPPRGGR